MLRFYENEHKEFPEAFSKDLSYKETEMVFKKLCRHYKINPHLQFGKGSNANNWRIQLANRWGRNYGVLCHELAHYYCYKYGIKSGHNKKMWKVMARMINYCKKMNYWEGELFKRTEIKVKPEPTKDELRAKKIDKRKVDLIRYEKRLAYFTKLYNNKIKKARRNIIMLEKHQNNQ